MTKSIISDMDGVVYRGDSLVPGAQEFIQELLRRAVPFLFLTNVSEKTPLDLLKKMENLGIRGLQEHHFITAAMATAMFLARQKPNAKVYCIGGPGLKQELTKAGLVLIDGPFGSSPPDFLVVGKTDEFHFSHMRLGVQAIMAGAKFIGTNPDVLDPSDQGFEPACGSLLASLEAATGKKPYIVGKPNPLMMTLATRKLGVHPDDTIMIGDRMDTDILGGLEAGMTTVLVLSGVSSLEDAQDFPYAPDYIVTSLSEVLDKIFE
jgi:NagD protein